MDIEKTIKQAKMILKFAPEDSIYFKTSLASKDENISLGYALQVCEIYKLKENKRKLNSLINKTSFQTGATILKYVDLLDTAEYIYESANDNPEFDKKITELNEYISSHIVKRKEVSGIKKALGFKRTTFREVGREDIKKTKESYLKLKEQQQQKYSETEAYLSSIWEDDKTK